MHRMCLAQPSAQELNPPEGLHGVQKGQGAVVQRGVLRSVFAGPSMQGSAPVYERSAGSVHGQADEPGLPGSPAVPAGRGGSAPGTHAPSPVSILICSSPALC